MKNVQCVSCYVVCVHRDLACVDISVCLQEDRQCLEVPACPLFPEGPVTEKQSVNAEPELHIQYKEERHFQKHPPVCCWCYCCTKHSPTFIPPPSLISRGWVLFSSQCLLNLCVSCASIPCLSLSQLDGLDVFFFFPPMSLWNRGCAVKAVTLESSDWRRTHLLSRQSDVPLRTRQTLQQQGNINQVKCQGSRRRRRVLFVYGTCEWNSLAVRDVSLSLSALYYICQYFVLHDVCRWH